MLNSEKKNNMNIYMGGDLQKKGLYLSRDQILMNLAVTFNETLFLDTSPMKYMLFINYINILTLFYKFAIFSINFLLFKIFCWQPCFPLVACGQNKRNYFKVHLESAIC